MNLKYSPRKIFRGSKISTQVQQCESSFDLDNPQHFINLVQENLRERILALPPHYFQMSEPALIQQVYGSEIPTVDSMLRREFWEIYNQHFVKQKKIKSSLIYSGICSFQQFTDIISQPGRLAFIIREPVKTQNYIKHAYEISIHKLLTSLEKAEGVNAKTGLPDASLLKLKFQIFQYLDQRLHGSLIQRVAVEQKTLQVNIDGNPQQQEAAQYSLMSQDEVQARLLQLEEELQKRQQKSLPEPQEAGTIVLTQVIEEAGRVSEEFQREDKRE